MFKSFRIISLLSIFVLIFSACNLPSRTPTQEPNIVFTAAALTVQAQSTQLSPFNTPTLPPPQPTNTAATIPTATLALATITPAISSTPLCEQALFVKDVTVPDGTEFDPSETFKKTWRFRNIGTCTWSGYSLVFESGDVMGGASPITITTVAPGQEVDISVDLTAPSTTGSYRGYWRIRNPSGVLIPVIGGTQNTSFFVDIKVSTPAFAVTAVTMTSSGSCGSFTINANIAVNGAGQVKYHWVYSDGTTDTATHTPLEFTAAGNQSVSTTWSTNTSGSKWMEIYIDSPNHQQFGRASFSCP